MYDDAAMFSGLVAITEYVTGLDLLEEMLYGIEGKDQPIMLLFLPIMLCCSAHKITYYAQYYAQEQELLSDYYAFYMQFCMSNSVHVANNFIKTVLLECINERYQ